MSANWDIMLLRQDIANLDESDRQQVEECAEHVRTLVDAFGQLSYLALSLVALEITLLDEQESTNA